MKYFFTSKKLFIISFMFIIFTNSIILYKVFDNRTGLETAQITLTQREFTIPYTYKDSDDSLSLRIKWRSSKNEHSIRTNSHWLHSEKLSSLSSGKAKFSTKFFGYSECSLDQGETTIYRGINPLDRAKYILKARKALQ